MRDGLPSNELYHLYQDKKGFMWISTDAGLVKYDGNTFKTFNSANGLPDNTVFETKEDKLGRIWFRTFFGGIGYILRDTVHSIEANDSIVNFQKGGRINSIAIDEKNTVFIGFLAYDAIGFLKIEPPYKKENITVVYRNPDERAWMDIILFPDNDFLVSESRKRNASGYYNLRIYTEEHKLLMKDSILYGNHISTLSRIARRNNQLVVANNFSLQQFDLVFGNKSGKKMDKNIINVYLPDTGDVWLSHRDAGLSKYDRLLQKQVYLPLLQNESVSFMLKDRNGGLWYATLMNGLFFSDHKDHTIQHVSKGVLETACFINPFFGEKFILGGVDGTYSLYATRKNTTEFRKHITIENNNSSKVVSVLPLDSNRLLTSYNTGTVLYRFDWKKSQAARECQNAGIFIDLQWYKSDILGCNYDSILILDPETIKVKRKISCPYRSTSFASNPKTGEAFCGTMLGLFRFEGRDQITDKDRIYSFRVKDLGILDDHLFVATKGYGLVVRTGELTDTITATNGLISNICEKIYINKRDCWLSSNLGLSCIKYKGYKNYEIINYSLKDLGAHSLIQDFWVDERFICFSSGAGIYTVPLERSGIEWTPFYIYSVEINNVSCENKDVFQLEAGQSNVKVNFGALYYNFAGNIKYRYRLLPVDDSWNYTRENFISFPALAPGSYSLLIQAQKSNGQWITCREQVRFEIAKPVWLRSWAIVVLLLFSVILISVLAWWFYKRKVKKERAKDEINLRFRNLEIKSMKAQMNPHFMFNALNSIQQLILSNENESAYRYFAKFSKLLRRLIESNTQETLSINDEVEILDRYLEIESLRFKDSFSYHIEVDKNLDTSKRIPHLMVQPFVENSIWHGLLPKKGERNVTIHFRHKNDREVECRIEDNGVGINASVKRPVRVEKRSLAMESITERLALFSTILKNDFGYTITDKSETGMGETGTRVIMNLPLFDR